MQDIGVQSKFLRGAGVVTRERGFLKKKYRRRGMVKISLQEQGLGKS